jgi:hypothetical protein
VTAERIKVAMMPWVVLIERLAKVSSLTGMHIITQNIDAIEIPLPFKAGKTG